MDKPDRCPKCQSKWPDIRGMVFPPESYEGAPCADPWHGVPEPVFTSADRQFLADLKVKV